MKFSKDWLNALANTKLSTADMASKLTMAGLEVDEISKVAAEFTNVVVGEVISCEQHPNADKLSVCKVNVADVELIDIVCGAKNVRAGIKVSVAKVGAVLGADFKIKKAKLRGEPSCGMICSASELGLADTSSGIMELESSAPVGTDFREYLNLNDNSIEIDLTANRGDCLSMLGLTREISALTGITSKPLELKDVTATINDKVDIKVEANEACPRYLSRVIKSINPVAKTPIYLQEHLRRSGIRSISPVVDVTNYVMLLLGQPMHAFDLATITGDISVRFAKAGESLQLLDDSKVDLDAKTLVIADSKSTLAIAGVMGGAASQVTNNSKDILLESAFFTPVSVAGCARRYGLQTDSSQRFERGVDPSITDKAMELATELLLEIVGGEAGAIQESVATNILPKAKVINLELTKLNSLLGCDIPKATVIKTLEKLGFTVQESSAQLEVIVPTYRFDISIYQDLVEEVARIYGYDNLPANLPEVTASAASQSEHSLSINALKNVMVGRGFNEAINYSFISQKLHSAFFATAGFVLSNPISKELAVMRASLLPGLLQSLTYNLNRQQARVRLFEAARVFNFDGTNVVEKDKLAAVVTGLNCNENWQGQSKVDFYSLKSDLEALLSLTKKTKLEFVACSDINFLHPGQAARVKLGGVEIGFIGAVHPKVAKLIGLKSTTYMFELDIDLLSQAKLPKFKAISKFPAIRRDLALVLNQEVSAQMVQGLIREVAGEQLISSNVFDVYTDEKLGKNKKSLAVSLILQSLSHTLTEAEIAKLIEVLTSHLSKKLKAELRE